MLSLITEPKVEIIKGVRCRERPDGKFVPTVSACLDLLFPDDGQWIPQSALERGERCHLWMQERLRRWDTPDHGLPDLEDQNEQARVLAAMRWFKKQGYSPALIEEPRFKDEWSGTVDLFAVDPKIEYPKQNGLIVDWKFCVTLTERYRLQGEVYRHLFPDTRRVDLA